MIRLSGLRRVTYKGVNNSTKIVIGNVTINNDIVSIIPDKNAANEITIFKERIIQIEKFYGDDNDEEE